MRRSLSKPGSAKESALAAQAIAINFVSHGEVGLSDQDELYQQILPALKNTAKNANDILVKCNVNMIKNVAQYKREKRDCQEKFNAHIAINMYKYI